MRISLKSLIASIALILTPSSCNKENKTIAEPALENRLTPSSSEETERAEGQMESSADSYSVLRMISSPTKVVAGEMMSFELELLDQKFGSELGYIVSIGSDHPDCKNVEAMTIIEFSERLTIEADPNIGSDDYLAVCFRMYNKETDVWSPVEKIAGKVGIKLYKRPLLTIDHFASPVFVDFLPGPTPNRTVLRWNFSFKTPVLDRNVFVAFDTRHQIDAATIIEAMPLKGDFTDSPSGQRIREAIPEDNFSLYAEAGGTLGEEYTSERRGLLNEFLDSNLVGTTHQMVMWVRTDELVYSKPLIIDYEIRGYQ